MYVMYTRSNARNSTVVRFIKMWPQIVFQLSPMPQQNAPTVDIQSVGDLSEKFKKILFCEMYVMYTSIMYVCIVVRL